MADEVSTVQELFDMLNGLRGNPMQQGPVQQGPVQQGPPPQQDQYSYGDGGEYSYGGPQQRSSGGSWMPGRGYEGDTDLGQGIADAVIGLAGNAVARRIGKRMRRMYEERIAPALDARMQQAQQNMASSVQDQALIAERYPDLRGCLRDQVLFLDGGNQQVVPVAEIRLPVTLAQADEIVARLR